MNSVIVLDMNYQFVQVESLHKAIRKIIKGKAEVVKTTGKIIWKDMLEPLVIRLVRSISHFYNRVIPWSKTNILIRDDYKCQYCGVTNHRMTIDHVHPQSKGGKNTYENTVACCLSCNQKKGDKDLDEVRLTLIRPPKQFTLYDSFNTKMKNLNINYDELW